MPKVSSAAAPSSTLVPTLLSLTLLDTACEEMSYLVFFSLRHQSNLQMGKVATLGDKKMRGQQGAPYPGHQQLMCLDLKTESSACSL